MKVEIERRAREEGVAGHRGVPRRQEVRRFPGIDARRILGEIALLGRDIDPGKERESLIGHQGHNVALALNRPELEGQTGAQGVRRRNHLRPGQPGAFRQGVQVQANEIRQEEEEAATPRGEPARRQREGAHIRHRFDERPRPVRAFLVQAARQCREALRLEHLPDTGRT